MTTLQLILRGGMTLTADIVADSLNLTEEPSTQQLTSITWDTPPGARERLMYVDPAEVAAAVVYEGDLEPDAEGL